MTDATCFIDTNILMYAVGSPHPLKAPCLRIIEQIGRGEIVAVTDTEVFQEIAYRYWFQKKWGKAVEVLRDYQCLFSEIYAIEKEQLESYYRLLGQYDFLSPRDAIHVAVMQHHRVHTIYSADRDLARLPFLRVIDPARA